MPVRSYGLRESFLGFSACRWYVAMYVVNVVDWHTFEIGEMPSDTLGLTVGTGLGVSVLAGILSGVCFIIGYRSRIGRKR